MRAAARAALMLSLACALSCESSRAELWTVDQRMESHVETNDNYSLTSNPGARVNTLSVTGAFSASRQSEASGTHVDASLTRYLLRGVTGRDHLEGDLDLSQSWSYDVDTFQIGANYQQDTTFNTVKNSAEVSLGRGQRRTRSVFGSWVHQFDERWSGTTQLTDSRVGYARALLAVPYENTSGSASIQYRLDETLSFNGTADHSDYRALDGSNRASTDDFNLGLARALSETLSGSVSLGRYRTRSVAERPVLVCPLQVIYCQGGVVDYVVAQVAGRSIEQGLQYSTSAHWQIDESSALSFNASRAQTPMAALPRW